MKWIADENLIFHNFNDITRIWLSNEHEDQGKKYFEIVMWDKVAECKYTILKLYLNGQEALEYFIIKMKKEFGNENILFLEE